MMQRHRQFISPRPVLSRLLGICLMSFILIGGVIPSLRAAAPTNIISYQGRLLDANSIPVSNTSLSMEFRFFDAVSGGNCVWSNSSSTCNGNTPGSTTSRTVTLTDGLFSEYLGDTAASTPYAGISDTTFANNVALYLEVEIAGETLSPRKRLVAAPYALNSQTLDGFDSADFLSNVGDTATGEYDFSGANFLGGSPLSFEGATANGFETTMTVTDPTDDRTITFQDGSGTVAFLSDVTGSATQWETGINGIFENDAAVIIGSDTAFTYASGGVGDLRVGDQLEVLGDTYLNTNLIVGASTSSTETIANPGFIFGGDDLFVAGSAGVEGTIYSDAGFAAGTVATISGTTGNIVTSGSIAANGGIITSTTDLTMIANGFVKIGSGVGGPDLADQPDDFYVMGNIEGDGFLNISGTGVFNAGADFNGEMNVNAGAIIAGAAPLLFEGTINDDFELTLGISNQAADRTASIPVLAADDTFAFLAATQTFTNKSLTSPTITASPTAAGATWADLGTVTTADINGGTIDGTTIGATSASSGAFTTLSSTGVTTIGNGSATVAINSNDWGINTAGAITGVSFDANGSGNSISNINNVDLTADTLDFTAMDDTMELDAATSITGTAGEVLSLSRTLTDAATENGATFSFTASDTTSATTSQFGLQLTNAASTEGLDAIIHLNNADTDDVVGAAIKITDAGGTFTSVIDNAGTLISGAELNLLDSGIALSELTDSGTLTAGTVDINGGTIDGTTIGATSASSGAFTTLSSTGVTTIGNSSATVAIDSSDWDIDAVGAITGVSFDANGSGNSISNIDNADLTNDTVDFDKMADVLTLDASTSITGAAGNVLSLVRTGTAASNENGMTMSFTSGVGDGTDVYSALNIGVTSADHSASSDKVYGLNIANLSSADADGEEVAISIGSGWDAAINSAGTLLSTSELNLLDSGIALSELTDTGTLTAATVDINGGTIDGTTIGATSASSGAFTTLSSTGVTTIGNETTDTLTVNPVSLSFENTASHSILLADEGTVDASAAKNLTIQAGNKTAGTGNGGDLFLVGGTSAGGTAGSIKFAGGSGSSGVTVSDAGAITVDGSSALNGGIAVDTSNFTVDGTSGAIHTASTLDVDSTSNFGADITFSGANPDFIITNTDSLRVTDGTNTLFTIADGGTTGNVTASGDLTISGDDLFMGTNTDGFILIADGTNYNPVGVSGDISLTNGGVIAIQANSVALGTDTTGNYVATLADAGGTDFTISGSGTESAAVTIDIASNAIDFDEMSDTLTLDTSTSITGAAGKIFSLSRTLTDAATENGATFSFTASDTTSATTSQFGLQLTNAASTEGVDALLQLNNADADDAVGAAIKITDAGGTFTNVIDNAGTLISGAELNLLDSGIALSELTDSGTLTAGTVDINGGTIDGTTIGATSASSGAFTTLSSTGVTTIGDTITDNITVLGAIQGTNALVFDGITDNTSETTFVITDPTADRTITFQNASGTVAFLSDIGGDTSLFTDAGATTYLTSTSDNFVLGSDDVLPPPFSVTVETNTVRIGDNTNDANDPTINFFASDATDNGSLSYLDTDGWFFSGGNVLTGANTVSGVNASFSLSGDDVFTTGDLGIQDSVYADSFIAGDTGATTLGNGTLSDVDGNLQLSAAAGTLGGDALEQIHLQLTANSLADKQILIEADNTGGGGAEVNFLARSNVNITATSGYVNLVSLGGVTLQSQAAFTGAGSITTASSTALTLNPDGGNAAGEDLIITANNLSLAASGLLSITPDAALTTAIDLTDTDLTNALSIGDNNIVGTTAMIDFTDFDVDADGNIVLGPDAASDSITTTLAAGSSRALVISATAAMTNTNGIIDLDVNGGNAAVVGADISLAQNNGATAGTDATAQNISLTANDADGDLFGIVIRGQNTTAAAVGSYEAGILIDNLDDTSDSMTDGIKIQATNTDGSITDGLDVSDAEITNAINIGANAVVGTNFSVTAAGTTSVTLSASTGDFALCHDTNGAGLDAIKDCNAAANADYAEKYPVAADAVYGDIVVPGTQEVITMDGDKIVQVVKSSIPYQGPVVGIVVDNYGDFTSAGNNIHEVDHPMPVALVGRIPVNVTNENGPIAVGDFITTSSTPGFGMKATRTGRVVGMALSTFTEESGQVMVQVLNTWQIMDMQFAEDGTTEVTQDMRLVSEQEAAADALLVNSPALSLRGSAWNGSAALPQDMVFTNEVAGVDDYHLSIRTTSDTEVAYLTNEGTFAVAGDMIVGNHLYPSDRGTPQTDKYIYYDGDAGPAGNFMRTNANGWATGSYDFAEMFPSSERLKPGEVVSFGTTKESVRRSVSAYDSQVMGIVSTRPGFLAGENLPNNYPIALAGRVPTNVSDENGSVMIGDPLTTSSTPGVAMKATKSGPIVGYALEPFSGSGVGSIIVFVHSGHYDGGAISITPGTQNTASGFGGSSSSFTTLDLTGTFYAHGSPFVDVGMITGLGNHWSIAEDGTIRTEGLITSVIKTLTGETVETVATTSPDVLITLSGTARLEKGEAIVKFDEVNPSFTKSIALEPAPIRVVATPNGPIFLYVTDKSRDGFTVRQMGGTDSGIDVDWIVTAYRKDYEPPSSLPTGEMSGAMTGEQQDSQADSVAESAADQSATETESPVSESETGSSDTSESLSDEPISETTEILASDTTGEDAAASSETESSVSDPDSIPPSTEPADSTTPASPASSGDSSLDQPASSSSEATPPATSSS